MLDIIAICLVITALLAYLNHRFVGLPTAIGVMAAALLRQAEMIARGAREALPEDGDRRAVEERYHDARRALS